MKLLYQKPLLIALSLFLLTLFFGFYFSLENALFVLIVFLILSVIGVFIFFLIAKKKGKLRAVKQTVLPILLITLSIALALFFTHSFTSRNHALKEAYHEKTLPADFLVHEVVTDPNYTRVRGYFTMLDGKTVTIKGEIYLFALPEPVKIGDLLTGSFSLEKTEGDTLPDLQKLADGYELSAVCQGELAIVSRENKNLAIFLSQIRNKTSLLLEENLPTDGMSMMKALLLGDRNGIDPKVYDGFQLLGISHLFAVSGLHLTILIGLFASLLEKLRVRQAIAYPLLSLITLFYMAMTGFAPSMLRAGGMLLLFYLSRFSRRHKDSITSLFAATAVILLIAPASILDIGLLLSFSATLGILVFATPISTALFQKPFFQKATGLRRVGISLVRAVAASVILTFSATAAILPVMWLIMGHIFSLAVLSNLVFSPFFTLLLLLLPVFLITLPIAPLSHGIGFLIDRLSSFVYSLSALGEKLYDFNFSLAYSFMPTLILLLLVSLVLLRIKKKGSLVSLLPVLLFLVLANGCIALSDLSLIRSESLYYQTDGKNDAMTVSYEKAGLLIDFSSSANFTEECYDATDPRSASIKTETWMLTSCRSAHVGTLKELIEYRKIKHLILPAGSDTADALAKMAEDAGVSVNFYEIGDIVYWNDIAIKTHANDENTSIAALEITLATKRVLYIKENAPMEFDIRFGVLSQHFDVLLYGANGNAATGGPFTFDADVIVEGNDENNIRKTPNTAYDKESYLVRDRRKD